MGLTEEAQQRARNVVEQYAEWWRDGEDVCKGLAFIYGHGVPESMTCYIHTSGYSMDLFPQDAIALSMMRDTQKKLRSTLVHEVGHCMFRKYWLSLCEELGCASDDVEDVKEVITVIHNDVFQDVEDRGYDVHAAIRAVVHEEWKKTENLGNVLRVAIPLVQEYRSRLSKV